ncbi:hypothetical protein [Streptomyces griseosporeus]
MDLDPEEAALYAAQAPVMEAAFAFADAYWVKHDMRETWAATHPTLRRCWAQSWMMPLLARMRADGFDRDEVAEAFVEDEVEHVLWEPFARKQIEHATLPVDWETWGVKVNPEPIAPDIALVRLLPVPQGGVLRAGETYASVPLLLQYEDGPGWRLLNFTSENVPTPGWPPQMG